MYFTDDDDFIFKMYVLDMGDIFLYFCDPCKVQQ